jgi:hypothetical protein
VAGTDKGHPQMTREFWPPKGDPGVVHLPHLHTAKLRTNPSSLAGVGYLIASARQRRDDDVPLDAFGALSTWLCFDDCVRHLCQGIAYLLYTMVLHTATHNPRHTSMPTLWVGKRRSGRGSRRAVIPPSRPQRFNTAGRIHPPLGLPKPVLTLDQSLFGIVQAA